MNTKGKRIKDFNDIVNTQSGKLNTSNYSHSESIGNSNNKRHWYNCLCECGNNHLVARKSLLKKEVLSCGCLVAKVGTKRSKEHRNRVGTMNLPQALYKSYIHKAGTGKLEFNLTFEYWMDLVAESCHYCGKTPDNTFKQYWVEGELKYSGVDRMSSSLGYIYGNVVPCCITCNRAKMDMLYLDFKEYIQRLVNYNK